MPSVDAIAVHHDDQLLGLRQVGRMLLVERLRKLDDHKLVQIQRGRQHVHVLRTEVRVVQAPRREGVGIERLLVVAHQLGPQVLVQRRARLAQFLAESSQRHPSDAAQYRVAAEFRAYLGDGASGGNERAKSST